MKNPLSAIAIASLIMLGGCQTPPPVANNFQFNYQMSGDKSNVVQVFDDGKQTFIQLRQPSGVIVKRGSFQLETAKKNEGRLIVIEGVYPQIEIVAGTLPLTITKTSLAHLILPTTNRNSSMLATQQTRPTEYLAGPVTEPGRTSVATVMPGNQPTPPSVISTNSNLIPATTNITRQAEVQKGVLVSAVPEWGNVQLYRTESVTRMVAQVHFANEKLELGPRGRRMVESLVAHAKKADLIDIRGQVEGEDMTTALRRARAIKVALMQAGVSPRHISVSATTDPLKESAKSPLPRIEIEIWKPGQQV